MSISKEDFFRQNEEFALGDLTTESINIKSKNLSDEAREDLDSAIRILQEIDQDALNLLEKSLEKIWSLRQSIVETLQDGGRVFISGCGATGRLALALETFYRKEFNSEAVIGFMAGGDYALIRSVERFEDKMEYGARQLECLGFGDNDLLLAVTEGGETSFVIGSAIAAKMTSSRKPFFIYCNPDDEIKKIKRSMSVLKDQGVEKLNLTVGPMAISGSTRMQAATAQMLAIALALFAQGEKRREFFQQGRKVMAALRNLSLKSLKDVIEKEASLYLAGAKVTYETSGLCAITILTDTTERSPTFSLIPFEKAGEKNESLAYLGIKGASTSQEAWNELLRRPIRGLSWSDLDIKIDEAEILKFDISQEALKRRSGSELFQVLEEPDRFKLKIGDAQAEIAKTGLGEAFDQIALKMAMNIHSTLIMGRLGRYEGNLMTYARPSNFKLVDRAARYVVELGRRRGIEIAYDRAALEIFEQMPKLGPDEPVVLKALEAFQN